MPPKAKFKKKDEPQRSQRKVYKFLRVLCGKVFITWRIIPYEI